jgi:hypothetical protein
MQCPNMGHMPQRICTKMDFDDIKNSRMLDDACMMGIQKVMKIYFVLQKVHKKKYVTFQCNPIASPYICYSGP